MGGIDGGWTPDTLKTHLQIQISELRRLLDERYQMQMRAVDAALAAAEQSNERMSARLRELERRIDQTTGSSQGLVKGWAVFVSLAGAVTAIVAVVITLVIAVTS